MPRIFRTHEREEHMIVMACPLEFYRIRKLPYFGPQAFDCTGISKELYKDVGVGKFPPKTHSANKSSVGIVIKQHLQ
jgi:hypothetical protein